jgi:cytochrome c biogenesis protein CcdA
MKVYGTIYIPVWIDQFGIRKYKTLFFTLTYMTSPYGQVLGFYFGTILFHDEWKSALNWIGAYLLILSTIFSFIPSKYFSTKYMFIGYEDKEQLVVTGKKKKNFFIWFR